MGTLRTVVLHIGTDEAGYGPLIGPLCIAAAVYESEGPRSRLSGADVDDSKVVYAKGGRDALARVLGPYLGLGPPLRLSELLDRLSVRDDPRAGYRWYGDVTDDVPAPGRAPRAFRRLYLNPVCERDYNAGCVEGGKGALLFRETMRVVRAALAAAPGVDAEIVCDKHGGRNRYAALLMAELTPLTLIPERESAVSSSYRLTLPDRSVRIRFVPKADGEDRPAALASMAAKYLRELFMEALNAYFCARVEDLRPTAGYYGDGKRFLAEIQPVLDEIGCDRDEFVRRS
jgi:ribonuclease HII